MTTVAMVAKWHQHTCVIFFFPMEYRKWYLHVEVFWENEGGSCGIRDRRCAFFDQEDITNPVPQSSDPNSELHESDPTDGDDNWISDGDYGNAPFSEEPAPSDNDDGGACYRKPCICV